MSFKYIDPGYGIFCQQGQTGVFKSNVFNPRNGVAFCTYGRSTLRFVEAFNNSIPELYLKFDIFLPETANGIATTSVYSILPLKLLQISQFRTTFILSVFMQEFNGYTLPATFVLNSANGDTTNLNAGKVNTIWLHVVSGSSGSKITVLVNNECVVDEISISDKNSLRGVGFDVSAETPVSNIIISDEEIALKEMIVEVGHSAIETTMTENNGVYSSAMVGAYVLQTLDTTDLYGLFGANSKVTGLVAIAAPAYTTAEADEDDDDTTGEDATQIKCRRVDGESVTDYWVPDQEFPDIADLYLENYSEEEIAALENKVPAQGKQLSIVSDTTFASLNGLKVGWVLASS